MSLYPLRIHRIHRKRVRPSRNAGNGNAESAQIDRNGFFFFFIDFIPYFGNTGDAFDETGKIDTVVGNTAGNRLRYRNARSIQ